MSLVGIFFNDYETSIEGLELDASVKETHTRKTKIAQYAIEEGSSITDHFKLEPQTLVIEGLIGGRTFGVLSALVGTGITKLSEVTSAAGGAGAALLSGDLLSSADDRQVDSMLQLENLWENAVPITVVTGLKTYENMGIESISYPVDKNLGDSLRFTISLKEVRIVETEEVSISPTERKLIDKKKAEKSAGKIEKKENSLISTKGKNATILKTLLDSVAG